MDIQRVSMQIVQSFCTKPRVYLKYSPKLLFNIYHGLFHACVYIYIYIYIYIYNDKDN